MRPTRRWRRALGGAQSIHLCSYDEGHGLPTEESSRIALRTQQVLAYETGVTKTIDPLGGSWYVEALTDRVEREILQGLREIEVDGRHGARDPAAAGSRPRSTPRAIATRSSSIQAARPLVGVNRYTIPRGAGAAGRRFTGSAPDEWGARRAEYLRSFSAGARCRWPGATRSHRSKTAWRERRNMVPVLMHALRAQATMGELQRGHASRDTAGRGTTSDEPQASAARARPVSIVTTPASSPWRRRCARRDTRSSTLGLHNSPRDVVKAAIEEDVDGIGVSYLSGQRLTQMRRLLEALREQTARCRSSAVA